MTTAVGGYRLSEILGSVSKHTLSEQVVEMLKRFIILEELQEGDRLPSDSIYAQWELYHKGASISPEDLRFHRALLKATNSQSLQHFDDVITASVRRIVYSKPSVLRRNIKGTSDFITEHQAIVDALRERDADKATRAMRVHIEEYYTQESTPAVSKSANGHKVLVTANT